MPTQKIDPKVIFASNAPAVDKPPVFGDKTKGWDVTRANDGRPEIKQMNKVQQDTDLKILWLNENSITPYDASIDYPDGAVTIKDGSFKQLASGAWVEFLDDFANKDEVKRGIANRYDSSLTYNSGERVVLTNGDIVKSTVDGNTNDPNVDMTGWVKTNSASQIIGESGRTQQEINSDEINVKDYGAIGDGALHTLQEWVDSGKFSNLLAIQIGYPNATALTNSIDRVAIQKCIDDCRLSGKVANGVSGDVYVIDAPIKMYCNADFSCSEFKVSPSYADHVIRIASTDLGQNLIESISVSLPNLKNYRPLGTTPTEGSVGLFIEGLIKSTVIFGDIRGFETNYLLYSDNANKYISYNNFYFGSSLTGAKLNIHMDVSGGGWINECTWFGGQFAQFSADTAVFNTTCLKITKTAGGNNAPNGHIFVGCSMEGAYTYTIDEDYAATITTSFFSLNRWIGCRFEQAQKFKFNQYALYESFNNCYVPDSAVFEGGVRPLMSGSGRTANSYIDVAKTVGQPRDNNNVNHVSALNSGNAYAQSWGLGGQINTGVTAGGALVVFHPTDPTKLYPTVSISNGSLKIGDGTANPTEEIYRYAANQWRMNVSLVPTSTETRDLGLPTLRYRGVNAKELNLSGGLGVFGTTQPTTKRSITGKKTPTTIAEQNAALDSIVSALAAYGLVSDDRTV